MSRRATLYLAFALYAALGLLPLASMVVRLVAPGWALGLSAFQKVFTSAQEWTLLWNSLALAALTTIATGAIGLPLAVALGRTDMPIRRPLTALFTLPLLLPPTVTAYGWYALVGRGGLLGARLPLRAGALLFGLPGCVLVLATSFLPVVLLLSIAALQSVNPKLEEAGRLCASPRRVLWGIALPQVLPAFGPALALVFCMALGEFGAPSFLRYNVFAVESLAQFSAFYDVSAATAAAVPLLALSLLALLALMGLPRASWVTYASEAGHPAPLPLGAWRGWTCVLVTSLWLLLAGSPFISLALLAASTGAIAEAWRRGADSLLRSLILAGVGASLLLPLGFLMAYGRKWGVLGRAVDALTIFFFALPGSVLGIGLIDLWNRPNTSAVYGSPIVLLIGLLAQLAVLPVAVAGAALNLLPRSMEEAAAVVGASWPRRLLTITVPLCRRGLAVAWIAGFLFCLRDSGLSLVLYPPGQDTLPVRLFTLMANGRPEMIAALCLLIMLGALLPLAFLGIVLRRRMPT